MTFDLDLDLDLEHTLDARRAGNHHVQLWPARRSIFVKSQKCPYHVTFDLDLDLEHTLDAGPSGDHRVQVWWRSSHVCGRRSDLRKVYRQTDRQTDDGRLAIA